MQNKKTLILSAENICKFFTLKKNLFSFSQKKIKAVDNVSLDIFKEETLGLVGESGSGKTTFGRTILRLIKPTSGRIIFSGEDITNKSMLELRKYRKKMQIIFQDPYSSLNPRLTIADILTEGMLAHSIIAKKEKTAEAKKLLEIVGLDSGLAHRYPHEFSGGQRQRINIARALSLSPEFIVCDEPVSALDVSVRAQILNLMMDLKTKFGLSYLFISHDLAVVYNIAERIAVMYCGKIVEIAETETLFKNPSHPYTQLLLNAIPLPDPQKKKKRLSHTNIEINNQFSDEDNGCSFRLRCKNSMEKCNQQAPELTEIAKSHFCACYLN